VIALRPNPAWFGMARIAARSLTIYRFQHLWGIVSLGLQLFLMRAVWEAAYGGRDSIDGVAIRTQIVFLTIALLQGRLLNIQIAWSIQGQVESGKVAIDLIRPMGFLGQMTAREVGRTFRNLTYVLSLIPLALLLGSLRPPDPFTMLPYGASLLLAYVVGLLTWTLVGLMSFWLLQINAIRAMLQMLSTFLAGTLVPLWFMPDALRTVLTFLPFQAAGFLPAAIYSGQVHGLALIQPFAVQLAWIVILGLAVRIVWGRAQRKIVVQGG